MKPCKQCQKEFEITDADHAFYKKIDVPEPTLCPDCRNQRRLSFRNERTLYARKCDKTGKQIISMYAPDAPAVVYEQSVWWSDAWDPLEYGRAFDFSRLFFEQFTELNKMVPHFSLYNLNPVNSEYINFAVDNKNCYLCFSAVANEECYYCTGIDSTRDSVDTSHGKNQCELCYDSVDVDKCYNSYFIQNGNNLTDCVFCYGCVSCNNCFGCVNMRNASYCWFNEQLSKEEYQKRVAAADLGSSSAVETHKAAFAAHLVKFIRRYMNAVNAQDSTGNYLKNVKSCERCYDVYDAEACGYMIRSYRMKDCYDGYGVPDAELMYEIMSGGKGRHMLFSMMSYYDSDIAYCDQCYNSQGLFGCVGLNKKKYCILNKQYTKGEYEALVPKIIAHMKETGEWGEFFPVRMSPFGYNETVAYEYYPIAKDVALAAGFGWKDSIPSTHGKETVKLADVPDHIKDADEEIVKQLLACGACGKNYKIIKQELKFYKKHGLPLPRHCPDCRMAIRLALRNPRQLWHRACSNCSNEFETTYAPDRPEKVFCEQCYQKEVV